MIIVETCPECGSDLLYEQLMTYPPINVRRCAKCGWSYSERQETIRVPFSPPPPSPFTSSGFSSSACKNCSNNPDNGGSGICGCTLGYGVIT